MSTEPATDGTIDFAAIPPELLATFPALSPPEGVVPNFENPDSLENYARGVIYAFLPVITIFVLLRVYVRMRITKTLGLDDYLSVAATLLTIGWMGIILSMLGNPLGPHQWNVRLIDLTETFVMLSGVQFFLYFPALILLKTSILWLYWRLFKPFKIVRISVVAGIVIITAFYMSLIIAEAVLCCPRPGELWTSPRVRGSCDASSWDIQLGAGIFGVISDIFILLLPVYPISKLQMSKGHKQGLIGVFATGIIATAFSVAGLGVRIRQIGIQDYTWETIPSYAVGIAEINIGIVVSCMPVIHVVFKGLPEALRSTMGSMRVSLLSRSTRSRSGKSTGSQSYDDDSERLTDRSDKPKFGFNMNPMGASSPSVNMSHSQQQIPLGAIQREDTVQWSTAKKPGSFNERADHYQAAVSHGTCDLQHR